MNNVILSNSFKKDLKIIAKRGYNLYLAVIQVFVNATFNPIGCWFTDMRIMT